MSTDTPSTGLVEDESSRFHDSMTFEERTADARQLDSFTLPDAAEPGKLYCSFCGKSQMEVKKLIAGPTVFICDECIGECLHILREEGIEPDVKPHDSET